MSSKCGRIFGELDGLSRMVATCLPVTRRVINPGSAGSDPFFPPPFLPGVAGDHVIFGAFRPDVGYEPWTTLGTDASTLPMS